MTRLLSSASSASGRSRAPRILLVLGGALGMSGLLCLAGCASSRAAQGGTGTALVVDAAPTGPLRPINTPEEANTTRQDLDYHSLGDSESARLGLRASLLHYYAGQAQEALGRDHLEEAYENFASALTLFQPADLRDSAHPAQASGAPELLSLAQRLDVAFRQRGAHAEVITALMVQRTLLPTDPGPAQRYRELAAWLAGTATGPRGGDNSWHGKSGFAALVQEPPPALVHDLEQAVRLWPAPVLVQELTEVYQALSQSFGLDLSPAGVGSGQHGPSPQDLLNLGMRRQPPTMAPAFKLAALYLRVSRPAEAIAVIQKLGKLNKDETLLLGALHSAFDKGAAPLDAVKLAMLMARDPDLMDVSLQVCHDLVRPEAKAPSASGGATGSLPPALPAYLCVGELAVQLDRRGLAVRAFERARELQPGDRGIWDKLGRLYQDRLGEMVGDERTTELEGALHEIEKYQAQFQKRFPDQPINLKISAALAEVGRGYYNAGKIADALRYLDRSVALEPNAEALEIIGTIHLKRGEGSQAVATLERARAVEMAAQQGDPLVKVYFKARIGRLIADGMDLQGDGASSASPASPASAAASSAAANEVRRASLRDWEQIVGVEQLVQERKAEAESERGKLYYKLGEREQSLAAFRRAIDLVPDEGGGKDQGQIYSDTIAYLVQQGELEDALDAYHRALGRARVVEYLKVYSSLWINDLALRSGQPEDPLATAFLKSVQGGKWYAELARWATGRQGEDVLFARADTPAKRAEANFYAAMSHLRAGDRAQSAAMLHKVVDSDMMAFFEYEMAATYLRDWPRGGPPDAPRLKSQRGKARLVPDKRDKRPAGSI